MEFERLFTWICFFFCLGLAATGVLVFFKEKLNREFRPVLFLQYFLISIYTYGFYSIWSGIFYRLIFEPGPGSEEFSGIPSFLILLGTPLLLIGFTILILWAVHFSKRKGPGLLFSGGVLTSLLGLTLYLFLEDFNWRLDIQRLYGFLFMLVVLPTCLFLSISEVQYLNYKRKSVLIILLFISGAIHLPLFFLPASPFLKPAFAFLFFLTNTCFCLFFIYSVKPFLGQVIEEQVDSFDSFFRKYGITPRESEIILEIYNGKTNKEIADSLFVTVQTIKDHTHRIYQKTNLKNRSQLASELRKFQ